MKTKPQLIIHGPTVRGTFFIANTDNHVWDGKFWRGFGEAEDYKTHREAFIATRAAKASMDRSAKYDSVK